MVVVQVPVDSTEQRDRVVRRLEGAVERAGVRDAVLVLENLHEAVEIPEAYRVGIGEPSGAEPIEIVVLPDGYLRLPTSLTVRREEEEGAVPRDRPGYPS